TREAAPIGLLAARLVRWGGFAVMAGAALGLALVDTEGLAGQLSAAAAVLVAAPLLTLRRTAEAPWVAAGAAAAERGIVYSSAQAMDAAGRVTVVALCAHGTITEGKPEVVEIHPVDDEVPADRVLGLIAGAEQGHPLGVAIRRYAEGRGVRPAAVRRATAIPGRGVTALGPDGERVVLGNRQLLLDEGISIAVADDDATRAEERGHTVLFAAVGERVRAVVALQDEVRLGARAAVQRLYDLKVEVVLVSGDHRTTVEALAGNIDIAHVRAELLPEERAAEVMRLREHGGPVAAVGDGTRDEAALSGADVPVVLEGAGAPAGERGIGLSTSDLRDATAALWIARAARTEAWRATLATVAAGSLLITGAAVGWLAPGLAAALAVGFDTWALPAGGRLLHRIALRVPSRA
ncbi:MAG: HAD-IC family P-type ATPase, partial [Myxococcota bacterium]